MLPLLRSTTGRALAEIARTLRDTTPGPEAKGGAMPTKTFDTVLVVEEQP